MTATLRAAANEAADLQGSSAVQGLFVPASVPHQVVDGVSVAPSQSVAQRAAHSVVWLVAQTAVTRVVQSLAQVVLAWLLSPADFGTISIVFTLSTLINALFQFGLDDVLVRRDSAMSLWFRSAFWMSLLFGCLSAAVLVLVAPLAARVYHEPRLTPLIDVMALATPLYALSVLPYAILRARLRFRLLSLFTFGDVVGTSLGSIALAAAGAGAFSFVLPLPILAACRAGIAWWATKPAMNRARRTTRWRKLLPSASAVLVSRLILQLIGQGDYIVFGMTATANQVGLYFFAFRIAGQPIRLLAGSLTGVLFPALSQFKRDPARQQRAVISSSRTLALVVMPLCFTQAAMAEPALALFFDPRWAEAAFFIQILSVALAFDAVSWTVGALLPARGEFRAALIYSAVTAVVFFAAILVGALADASYGVPLAVTAYYILAQPAFCFFVLRRTGGVSLASFLAIYAAPALVATVAVLCALVCVRHMLSPAVKLVLLPAIALTLYSVGIWQLSPEPCRCLLTRLKAMVGVAGHRGRDDRLSEESASGNGP